MTSSDRILALLSALVFAAYMAVLVWKVPDPALIGVSIVGFLMCAYDFSRTSRRARQRARGIAKL